MRSLSSVGLALSLIFGCLVLALVAELYYLLWWKKRITNREIEDDYSSPAREFLYMFCWKQPSSLSSTALNPQQLCSSDTHVHEPQSRLHSHPNEDLLPNKPFEEEGAETEPMRLQNLSGPPRFLFTIKEETKEDLESEDGKSREGSRSRRSLSDLLLTVETPFLTPLASPPYFTPPLTPMDSSHNHHGFNPLFESSTDAEFNMMRLLSPPPKFKFLKDAEDKLHRREQLMEEAEREKVHKIRRVFQEEGANIAPSTSVFLKDEENGGFITLIVAKNKERELNHPHHHHSTSQQHHSSSSQVLPLVSSPSSRF
ncbi:unnamed protein product [Camellia sinensis]